MCGMFDKSAVMCYNTLIGAAEKSTERGKADTAYDGGRKNV